jgi:hypothetical protein
MGDIFSYAQRVLIWAGLDNRLNEGARCLKSLIRLRNLESERIGMGISIHSPLYRVCSETRFRYLEDSDVTEIGYPAENVKKQLKRKQNEVALDFEHQDERRKFVKHESSSPNTAQLSTVGDYEYDLFGKFFRRPYFTRRWIIQEVSLAKEISLYCGDTAITENLDIVVAVLRQLPSREWPGSEEALKFLAMLTLNRLDQDLLSTPVSILRESLNFKCRDPKDHVFAMLGIFESKFEKGRKFSKHHFLRAISYQSSIEDVYTALAKYQLTYKEDCQGLYELLTTAGAMGTSSGTGDVPTHSLPSWVPAWRKPLKYIPCSFSTPSALMTSLRTKHIEPISTIIVQPGILQTCGSTIDTIVDCIKVNLLDPEDRERLRSRLDGWFTMEYYQTFHSSALEVISGAIVAHCYENFPPEYSSFWLFDNKKKLFDAIVQRQEQETKELQDFLNVLPKVMHGRSFVLTRSGHIGISCDESESGDSIVMIRYGRMPFVMRPLRRQMPDKSSPAMENQTDTYKLVSDVYIHRSQYDRNDQFAELALKSLLIY